MTWLQSLTIYRGRAEPSASRCSGLLSVPAVCGALLFLSAGVVTLQSGIPVGNATSQLIGTSSPSYDWSAATELFPGIRHARLNLTSPRTLAVNVVRVDLSNPDIRLTTTPRAPAYVENNVETIKQTTGDFLTASRRTAKKLVVAVNGTGWTPFPAPFPDPGTANVAGLLISDGVQVSPVNPGAPQYAVFYMAKDWTVGLVPNPPDAALVSRMLNALQGGNLVLFTGVPEGDNTSFEPRTGYGISADGRFLYLMTVDGRRTGYSLGCSLREVGEFLRYFGATNGINMDGGGSTSLARWNSSTSAAELLNRPSDVPDRAVGNNLGVYHISSCETE